MSFGGYFSMSCNRHKRNIFALSSRTISLRLHPDEVDMLSILAQRLRVSKSDILLLTVCDFGTS